MATEKNDENISDYSLSTELLASAINQEDYRENVIIKSQPELNDLSVADDNSKHEDDNLKIDKQCDDNLPTTFCSDSLMISATLPRNLSECLQNSYIHDSSSLTTSSSVTPVCARSFTKQCVKNIVINTSTKPSRIVVKPGAEFSLHKRTSSAVSYEPDNDILKKLKRNFNGPAVLVDNRQSSLLNALTTDENRFQTPGIYEDASGYVFQDSTYDTPIEARFETGDEWEMSTENSLSDVSLSLSQGGKSSQVLMIQQKGSPDTLRDDLEEVVGESQLTVLSVEDCINVNMRVDLYSLVWMHLLAPLNTHASNVLNLLKPVTVPIIVVTDKAINEELPLQAENYVEPLTKETIHRLCYNNGKETTLVNAANRLALKKPSSSVRNSTRTPESTISSVSGKASNGSPMQTDSPPKWCRIEHATKEKQRRERIKDSCDQLRVLLPYVKGRKTDMASILEMTVDYLKIVNSTLSQDFHTQVIDIMSNGNIVPPEEYSTMNMGYKKTLKRDKDNVVTSSDNFSPNDVKGALSESKSVNVNKRMVTRSVSRNMSTKDEVLKGGNMNKGRRNICGNGNSTTLASVPKRGYSNAKMINHQKKLHGAEKLQGTKSRALENSILLRERKIDNVILEEGPTTNQLYQNVQFPHMFTEGDLSANRMLSSRHVSNNNTFAYISHSQINLQSTHNLGERTDMNNYGNICYDSTYLPYSYSNLQDSNNGNFLTTEYVNPNAVLPVNSYAPRVSSFSSGRRLERMSTFNKEELKCEAVDMYNNSVS